MKLSVAQIKYLRGLAHTRKPVIMIGSAGLTEAVINEFVQTLEHHELIKVKVSVGDRDLRDEIVAQLCKKSAALLVQRIGNIATLFKQRDKNSRITLPIA